MPEGKSQGGQSHDLVSARIRSNGYKLEHRKFSLNFRKHFCAVWVMGHKDSGRLRSFFLRDLQKLPGHGHDHPAVGAPSGAGVGADRYSKSNCFVIL